MNEDSKDVDRDGLKPRKAYWSGDPEQNLTEPELDHVLEYFGASETAEDPNLRSSLQMQFQEFMVMVLDGGFREKEGRLEKASKPSTIIKREMKQVETACAKLDAQLAGLDQMTRNWLDQQLEEIGVTGDNNAPVRLRHLEAQIQRPIETLIFAARAAEGITLRGPNKIAERILVERLADCWEIYHRKLPTTDKGRGRRDETFLELCQKMARFAHVKLQAKGAELGTLNLSGIVADVLKERRSRPKE
jgi:hypothetical protein